MSTIRDTDQFLVQRGSNSYKQSAKDLMSTIKDTDLMLVQRGDESYKVTCEDVKDQLGGGGGDDGFTQVVITPASITPLPDEQLIYCTTDISPVNGSIPADVKYQWYQYDNASGDTGKVQLGSDVVNRKATDNIVLPSSAAGKYIGCTVTYLNVTKSETSRCQVLEPAGPTAVMHGLRLDVARQTSLTRDLSLSPGDITVSCWMKQTSDSQYKTILSSDSLGVLLDSGGWSVNNFGNSQYVAWNDVSDSLNTWINVVTQFQEDRTVVYVNGKEVVNAETASRGSTNAGELGVGWFFSTSAALPGYLSEYYFVQHIVPPETFGKKYAEGWGPLDSTQVEAKLRDLDPPPAPKSPYDTRPWTGQVWSSGATTDTSFVAGRGMDLSFNGDLTDFCASTTTGTTAWVQANLSAVSCNKLEIYMPDAAGATWTVSGTNITTTDIPAPSKLTWFEIPVVGAVSDIRVSVKAGVNARAHIGAVKINDRLLVDNGVWNVDENWSDGGENNTNPSAGWDKAFDGDLTTHVGPPANVRTTWTGEINGSLFEIYGKENNWQESVAIKVNGQTVRSHDTWTNVTDQANGKLTSLSCADGGAGRYSNIRAVRVDGAILVDSGAQYNTDENWSELLTNTANSGWNNPPSNGFDGDKTTYAQAADASADIEFTYSADVSTVTMYADGRTQNQEIVLYSSNYPSGESKTTSEGINPEKLEWNNVGTLTKVVAKSRGSQPAGFSFIQLDDEVLLNGPTPWNTSQVWSDDLSASGGTSYVENPLNAFDGSTDSLAQLKGSSNGDELIFGATLTGVTKLEILNRKVCDISGTGFSTVSGAAAGWVTLHDGASTTISDITLTKTGDDPGIYAVRLNDELLVNGGVGPNGFYLPFNPANKGANYSQHLRTNTSFSKSASKAFNGNLSDNAEAAGGGGSLTTWIQLYKEFTGVKTLELLGEVEGSSPGVNLIITGDGIKTTSWENGGAQKISVPLTSTTIDNIGITAPNNTQEVRLAGIWINGELLVDHSSIGVDMSGNDNSFHDQNYNLSVLAEGGGDKSQSWATYLWMPSDGTILNPQCAFDGVASTYMTHVDNNKTVQFRIPVPVGTAGQRFQYTVSSDVDVYNMNIGPLGKTTTLREITKTPTEYSDVVPEGGFVGIEFGHSSMTGKLRIHSIEVNNVPLLNNGDFSLADTVLDTPMNNYATLVQSDGTPEPTEGSLYWDYKTASWNRRGSGFVISKKTYVEFMPGRVSQADRVSFGICQNLSGEEIGKTAGEYGYHSNGKKKTNNTLTDYGETYSVLDAIGMLYDPDAKTIQFFKNGVSQGIAFSDIPSANYRAAMGLLDCAAYANFGQQPYLFATRESDGSVTVGQKVNDSKVWSDNVTATYSSGATINTGRSIAGAFDGVYDQAVAANGWGVKTAGETGSGTLTFDTPLTGISTVTVYCWVGGDVGRIYINRGEADEEWQAMHTGVLPYTFSVNNLTNLSIDLPANNGGNIQGIFVDGALLVNEGLWNTSEVWSEGSTAPDVNPSDTSYATLIGGGFNGNVGDLGGNITSDNDLWGVNVGTVEWNGDIDYSSSIKLWAYTNPGRTWYLTINGNRYDVSDLIPASNNGSPGGATEFAGKTAGGFPVPTSGKLTRIELISTNGGYSSGFTGMYVDNKLLVDGTITAQALQQPWSEWVDALTLARLEQNEERISYLEQVIIDQSVPFERRATYDKGAIVDMGGELFEAQVDNADVTAADFVARLLKDGSSEWMKLDIRTRERPSFSPQPTPTPTPEPVPTPEPFPSGGTSDQGFDPGSISGGFSTSNG